MAEQNSVVDWSQLDMIRESFSEEFASVYAEFLAEIPSLLASLHGTVGAGDAQGASRLAHQIKGTAANFGFSGVSGAMAALEIEAKKGSLEGAPARVAEAQAAFARAVEEVKSSRGA